MSDQYDDYRLSNVEAMQGVNLVALVSMWVWLLMLSTCEAGNKNRNEARFDAIEQRLGMEESEVGA